jgi:small conductance mechanosensitive channel
VVVIARRTLSFVQRRALAWERLTANDAAVDAFFNLLKTVVTTGLWLSVLAVVAIWLGLPPSVPALLLLALRVYLIGAIGLLLVRGIASVVDTLDALSAKFAGPTTLLRYYHDLRGLVPLLRRCIELAIWLGVASLVVLQIESIAAFAVYGPRLIQAVGVFFVARVAAEAADLIITRSQGDTEGLSDTERQQRATLIPLVLSFVRGAIYFVALVVMLTVLDLNPLPLLAGAGILGVVVGFGAQPVITDVVSGFFILFENQFLVGDYVEIGNARGVVEAIQLRTTRIRDPNGQQHIVRNGLMSGVVNYSKAYTFAVVELEVRYETDLRQVYNVLTGIGSEFATDHQDVLEPTVVSGVERFTGSGIVIRTTTKVGLEPTDSGARSSPGDPDGICDEGTQDADRHRFELTRTPALLPARCTCRGRRPLEPARMPQHPHRWSERTRVRCPLSRSARANAVVLLSANTGPGDWPDLTSELGRKQKLAGRPARVFPSRLAAERFREDLAGETGRREKAVGAVTLACHG